MKTYTFNQAVKILNQLIPGVGDAMRDNAYCGSDKHKLKISEHISDSFTWDSPERLQWIDIYMMIAEMENDEII